MVGGPSEPAALSAIRLAFAAAPAVLAAAPAQAGESACSLDRGVVVVPAEALGIAGDYILDTGQARSVIHETRAQSAALPAEGAAGTVRVAGLVLEGRLAVESLDARTAAFPTPVAGVIGADLLAGLVVDLHPSPCRVVLSRPGEAPAFRAGQVLRLEGDGPARIRAAVADGPAAMAGGFLVSTGTEAMVRLSTAVAGVGGAETPEGLLDHGRERASLRALSLAGRLYEHVPSGLTARLDGGEMGVIGAPVLARLRLRFDFPGRTLTIAHEKGPPETGGP